MMLEHFADNIFECIFSNRSCYASTFTCHKHYVFSCPSVHPKPEMPSLVGFVGPFDQQWPFLSCLSICHSSKVSGDFPENPWKEWPPIWHASVSRPLSELIRFWSWPVDFHPFGATLTSWYGSNFRYLGISWRMHGGNGLEVCMLMYLDHRQNWLDFSHGLLIFLLFGHIFTLWNWWNLRLPAFSWEHIGGMAWMLQADVSRPPSELIRFWSCSVDFPHFGAPLTKWNFMVIFGVSSHYLENTWAPFY